MCLHENPAKEPHKVWIESKHSPHASKKAAIKAQLMTGTYRLQCNRARFNQHKVSPVCPLCKEHAEDTQHFILKCSALKVKREPYLEKVKGIINMNLGQEGLDTYYNDEGCLTKMIIDSSGFAFTPDRVPNRKLQKELETGSLPAKVSKRNQLARQEEEYKKSPHSFVIHRGHVGKNVKQLVKDLRRVMEPFTASHLQVRRKNVLKDFVSIAGVLNVSHFIILTKSEVSTNLRICRLPRGPTLTFKVHNYCLSKDVVSALRKPNMEEKQFLHHPLVVMNNFSSEQSEQKLMSSMFQNMFLSINVNRVNLNNIRRVVMLNYNAEDKTVEFRHYNIKVVPVGMSRGVKKLIKATVPDMSKYRDVSDYIMQGGNLSESEAEQDGEHNEVELPQELNSRGNIKSAKSAIRLTEIGPRMTLQLVKVEEGVCQGDVIFHEFVTKTEEELKNLQAIREKKTKLKAVRKKQQEENVRKKQLAKEEHKQKSLKGMKRKMEEDEDDNNEDDDKEDDDDEDDDAEYYKQEVGETPDPDLFLSSGKANGKRPFKRKRQGKNSDIVPSKKRKLDKHKAKFHEDKKFKHSAKKKWDLSQKSKGKQSFIGNYAKGKSAHKKEKSGKVAKKPKFKPKKKLRGH